MALITQRTLGAIFKNNKVCQFRCWAPYAKQVQLEIIPERGQSFLLTMQPEEKGYYFAEVNGIQAGDNYYFIFNGQRYPDLASDFQPEGVMGPSQVIAKNKPSHWPNIPIKDYIIYELHVGTYTTEGNFKAIIPHLKGLKELGITAIEIMPVAQFSGTRNWGYDGVFPFAVQNSYGGPSGLKTLVHACHELDIAVVLDVVYNHLGPEGNFFDHFGPYFTSKYNTLWGKMLNYDDEHNHHVRRYFIENALHWFIEYGIDALRLDALHAIVDVSAYPFLEELADSVNSLSKRSGRAYYLIAENDANDLRLILPKSQGGFGMQAQWNDDFHHIIHSLLTQEQHSYYQDFHGIQQLIKAYKEGFIYSGEYSPFRRKPHGRSSKNIPGEQFVVCIQNHDQIGNRAQGERLSSLVTEAKLKLAAGLYLCAPFIPLMFMGEEYGETAPFQYFVSHRDAQLIEAVRKGRAREFAYQHDSLIPDPQSVDTFLRSRLNHELKSKKKHKKILNFYRELLKFRKQLSALASLDKTNQHIQWHEGKRILMIQRKADAGDVLILASFSDSEQEYASVLHGSWELILNSQDRQWTEPEIELVDNLLEPYGFLLFKEEQNDG
ncbi:malto-oligosyltrehalose trehalohydrolase [Legionella jordanis]|uniref:Malto-oligosyltrehalose trehalohydrolase n=1 Tax=Legionella jordanis TaxID=456 RepID=A0A0W0VAM8_9GAMM|nr:malto-oligosyltrehalose trehalohydrolase [Legionella jordanis]KTD17124.1 Malto-oligosyltrehalose trehalohydrolase [Legionella jordanis]RMX03254.1 malto-oligosyltrehalose trehalohydrolase [Legionella jordanis]RMX18231.1 malto-oligosyltrehalose trehalohydrolase [Legionella jordanis]VEH12679.1 Malto-oligosyltrehalose trehalohydrolase [Legionella jordanis]